MEYELNKKYPRSELPDIYKWYEDHQECDINEIDGEIVITLRDPEIYKNECLENLKRYLSDTDYVVIKLYEAFMNNKDEYETLKIKYQQILEKRVSAREEINRLEK